MTNPKQRTTQEIWDLAKRSISPTKPIHPRYAHTLHPKMIKALGKFGWDEAATRETEERRRLPNPRRKYHRKSTPEEKIGKAMSLLGLVALPALILYALTRKQTVGGHNG